MAALHKYSPSEARASLTEQADVVQTTEVCFLNSSGTQKPKAKLQRGPRCLCQVCGFLVAAHRLYSLRNMAVLLFLWIMAAQSFLLCFSLLT